MKTSELHLRQKFQALVFGRYGSGKTFGALTFPRPCVMDLDKGIAVIQNPSFVSQYGKLDVEYEQFSEKQKKGGIPIAHNAFDDACRFFDKMMAKDKVETFDTWVIDSLTSLGEFAATKAIILLGSAEFKKMSNTQDQAVKTGLIVPRMQDFGSERSLVEQFVDMVLDTDKHVVVICHEKELMNDAGNITGIVPLLTGKSVENVPLKFDEVYRLVTKPQGPKTVRILETDAYGTQAKVKSRYGVPSGTEWNWPALNTALSGRFAPIGKDK